MLRFPGEEHLTIYCDIEKQGATFQNASTSIITGHLEAIFRFVLTLRAQLTHS
jgi:hypothetical protein